MGRASRRKRDPKHRAKMAEKRARREGRSARQVARAQRYAESEQRLNDLGLDVARKRGRRG